MVSTLTLFTTYINANIGQNETVEIFVTLIKALNTIINAHVRYNNQLLTLITTITTYTECNKDAYISYNNKNIESDTQINVK